MFYAKELEKIEIKPGCWKYTKMGIFQKMSLDCREDIQIGEYVRHYSSYGEKTFCPFEKDGKWYAVYSEDYTCTYLMSLPDCKKIGGEEPKSNGFCPTEYWVPKYRIWNDNEYSCRIYDNDENFDKPDKFTKEQIYYDLELGFVSGTVWGADSGGWKVERLNLTKCDQGIIERTNIYGYAQMPSKMGIREAVQLEHYGDEEPISIEIAVAKHANIFKGEIEVYD